MDRDKSEFKMENIYSAANRGETEVGNIAAHSINSV
jgi:hypothetical protein